MTTESHGKVFGIQKKKRSDLQKKNIIADVVMLNFCANSAGTSATKKKLKMLCGGNSPPAEGPRVKNAAVRWETSAGSSD